MQYENAIYQRKSLTNARLQSYNAADHETSVFAVLRFRLSIARDHKNFYSLDRSYCRDFS